MKLSYELNWVGNNQAALSNCLFPNIATDPNHKAFYLVSTHSEDAHVRNDLLKRLRGPMLILTCS